MNIFLKLVFTLTHLFSIFTCIATCLEFDGSNEAPEAFSPAAPPNVYDAQGTYPGFINITDSQPGTMQLTFVLLVCFVCLI